MPAGVGPFRAPRLRAPVPPFGRYCFAPSMSLAHWRAALDRGLLFEISVNNVAGALFDADCQFFMQRDDPSCVTTGAFLLTHDVAVVLPYLDKAHLLQGGYGFLAGNPPQSRHSVSRMLSQANDRLRRSETPPNRALLPPGGLQQLRRCSLLDSWCPLQGTH